MHTSARKRDRGIVALGRLIQLPNRSRYPRGAFFDTAEHLSEPWQIIHSIAVAEGLADLPQPDRITAGARHAPP